VDRGADEGALEAGLGQLIFALIQVLPGQDLFGALLGGLGAGLVDLLGPLPGGSHQTHVPVQHAEQAAHAVSEKTGGAPAAAIELPDGTVVTGKTGPLLGAASSALLNALKKLAGIDQELDLVSAAAIEPIQTLKTNYLGSKNPRLHTDEILIALSSSAAQNPTAAAALKQLSHLKGCDMHSTVILSSVDMDTVKKLGMYLTCEPTYEEADRMYHKK